MPKSPADSKPYHHGQLKSALVQAALQAIESRGMVEFNLREIAQHCQVSVAAVYRHFASKNELLIELAQQGFGQLSETFGNIMQQPGQTDTQRLKELGLAYVCFAMEHEGLFRVMFSRELCQLPEFARIAEMAGRTLKMLQAALGPEPQDSACQGIPTRALAAWSQVHGLAFLWLDNNLGLEREDFLAQVDAILND